MSEVVIALCMWAVAACVTLARAKDSDRSVAIAATLIAVCLTANVDALYRIGDAAVGGRNWLDLISSLCLIVGITFLLRGVIRATRSLSPRTVRWAVASLIAVCVVMVIAFATSATPATSTSFMLQYGSQPSVALYSAIQFAYVGCSMLVMARVSTKHFGEMRLIAGRLGLVLVANGCFAALMLSTLIIGMDLTHVLGNLELMGVLSLAYEPLYVAAIVLLCVGHSIPPFARRLDHYMHHQKTSKLIASLRPHWRTFVQPAAAIPVTQYVFGHAGREGDQESILHRMIVELRDATLEGRQSISLELERSLSEAENHLANESLVAIKRWRVGK